MEIAVPIIVKYLQVGGCSVGPLQFQNTIVPDCPPYTPDGGVYRRTIKRIVDNSTTWPPHPTNEHGRMLGAIVLIKSTDNMYVLVRNGNLWGLPKGARNYPVFLEYKKITDKHYMETGSIYSHDTLDVGTPESSIDNVIRETQEETGIIIDPLHLYQFAADDKYYTAYDRYVYEYPHTVSDFIDRFNEQSKNMDSENDVLMWISEDNLMEMVDDQLRDRQKKTLNQLSIRFLDEYLSK